MTPKFDKNDRSCVGRTILKPLAPRITPIIISATAVGTALTCNRAIKIGTISANKTTKNKDNCATRITSSFILSRLYKILTVSENKKDSTHS